MHGDGSVLQQHLLLHCLSVPHLDGDRRGIDVKRDNASTWCACVLYSTILYTFQRKLVMCYHMHYTGSIVQGVL